MQRTSELPFSTQHLQTVTEELWGLHLARLACIQLDPSLFASVSFRSTRPNSRNYKLLMLKLKSRKLWAYQGKTLSKRALHSSEQYIRPQVRQGHMLVGTWCSVDFCSLRTTRPPKQLSSGAGGAPVFCIVGTSNGHRSSEFSATSMEAAGWSTIITEMSSQ